MVRSIHSTTDRSTTTQNYIGKRHARLTSSMLRHLPKMQRLVLMELRYRLKDGETKHISQDTLQRATGLSEATISTAMRLLAGETVVIKGVTHEPPAQTFIRREWVKDKGDGRAGYMITMLPPPELRTRAAPPPAPTPCPRTSEPEAEQLSLWDEQPAALEGSSSMAVDVMPEEGTTTPENDDSNVMLDDPSTYIYTHAEQQQQASVTEQKTASQEKPNEIWSDTTWAEMLAGTQGYTRSHFYADKAALLNRPGYGIGMIVEARRNGLPVWKKEELDDASPRRIPTTADNAAKPRPDNHRPGRSRRAAEQPQLKPAQALDFTSIDELPFIDLDALGLSV